MQVAPDQEKQIEELPIQYKFTEEEVASFYVKVLGIASAQLAFVMIFAIGATFGDGFRSFFNDNLVLLISAIIWLSTSFGYYFNTTIRTAVPYNYILLTLLSLSMTFVLTSMTARITEKRADTTIIFYLLMVFTTYLSFLAASLCKQKSKQFITFFGLFLAVVVQVILCLIVGTSSSRVTLGAWIGGVIIGVLTVCAFIWYDLLTRMPNHYDLNKDFVLCSLLLLYIDFVRGTVYVLTVIVTAIGKAIECWYG